MKTTRTLRCFLLFKTLILGACIVLHEDLDDEMYDSFWDRQNKKECPQSLHLGPSTRIPQEWTEDENCFDVNWETPSMVLNACGNINVLSRQSSFCTSFSAHLSSARRKKAECSLRCGLCKHGMLPLAESRCVKSPRCHGMPKKPCEALATSSKKTKTTTIHCCVNLLSLLEDQQVQRPLAAPWKHSPQRRREPQTSFGLGHLNSQRENTRH